MNTFGRRTVAGLILLLGLLVAVPSFVVAGDRSTPVYTSDLNFRLGDDTLAIKTTVSSTGETQADIDLKAWWDTGTAPEEEIDVIEVQVCYDPDVLEFDQSGSSIDTANWSGSYAWSTFTDGCSGDGHRVKLRLYNTGTPTDEPQENPTTYATLRFRALCQRVPGLGALTLISGNCYMELTNDTQYVSTDFDDGSVAVQHDYEAIWSAGDNYSDCSQMGQDIDVPVSARTTFLTHYVRHTFVYDTVRLAFDSVALADTAWELAENVRTNLDTIEIKLDPTGTHIDELNDEVLYRLWFTGAVDTIWDGSDNKASIDFVQNQCDVEVNYNGGKCEFILPSQSFDGAEVWHGDHYAELSIVNDCNDCDYLIANTSDDATVQINLQNAFSAGGGTDWIQVIVYTGPYLEYADWEDISDDVAFDRDLYSQPNGADKVVFSQNDQDFYSCSLTDSIGMTRLSVRPISGFPTPSDYDDRKIDLQIASFMFSPTLVTVVKEASTGQAYGYGSGLDFRNGFVEYPVVEFSTSGDTNTGDWVSSALRVRNNFELDTFSVTISGSGDVSLDCVIADSNFTATDNGDGTWTVEMDAGTTISANGDNYTSFGTAYYVASGDCGGCNQNYGTAAITVDIADGSGDVDVAYVEVEGAVSPNCCHQSVIPCDLYGNNNDQRRTSDDSPVLPSEFALHQNHPNPFNPNTIIAYDVPRSSHVRIEIYNVLGRLVATLVDRNQGAGYHEVEWDASNNASGVYLYRMQAGDFVETRKMMLVK